MVTDFHITNILFSDPPSDPELRWLIGEKGKRNILCFAINPNKADINNLDGTSRNVRTIAANHGYDGWILANLYPIRTSSPTKLPSHDSEKMINSNLKHVAKLLEQEDSNIKAVWIAWGNILINKQRAYLCKSALSLLQLCQDAKKPAFIIGLNKTGHPYHPSNQVVNPRFGGVHQVRLQSFCIKAYASTITAL